MIKTKHRQNKVVLTKVMALQIALNFLGYRTRESLGGIESLLGWNYQICVYRLPNGTLEVELYPDWVLKELGTSEVTLNLPGEPNHGLEVLYRWTVDYLVKRYMK